MDEDLKYLVRFFTDKEHPFKTISMAETCQIDEISDKVASQKGWHWGRYSKSERNDYLQRRRFVEKQLYDGYIQEYGSLKEKAPIYFYLYPNITRQKVREMGLQRTRYGEIEPKVLMVKIKDIDATQNMTFTLNDSFTAYWKRAKESGIKCIEGENHPLVLQDHNKVFPFSMIEQLHRKYKAQKVPFEIQIWDYELLERIRYTILGEEKA